MTSASEEEKAGKDAQRWIEEADPEDIIVASNSETDEARFELICSELGNKSARRILKEIANGSNTSSLLAEKTELSVQDVLVHLDRLVTAGLIEKADSKMPSFRGRKANSYRISRVAVLLMPNETANKLELRKLIQRKSFALLRKRLLSSIGLSFAVSAVIFGTLLQALAVHRTYLTISGTVVTVTDYSTALPVAIVAVVILSPVFYLGFMKVMKRILK